MRISLNVAVSLWKATDFAVELPGGRHDLPSDEVKLSAGLLRAIAAAAGAGVVEILDVDAKAAKVIDGVVEPDEISAAKYAEAFASGAWLEGHLEDVIAQRERQAESLRDELADESLDAEVASELVEKAAYNDRLLAEARSRLAMWRGDD